MPFITYRPFLLQVSPDQLMIALTTRAIETFGERIVKQLDAAAASVSRDALAKNLYAKLFDWLVAAINRKISAIGNTPADKRVCIDICCFFKALAALACCCVLAMLQLWPMLSP